MLWLILGSAGTGLCAMLFFMMTAFGGGGLVAPGRPPLSRAIERWFTITLIGGPVACAALGVLPWITGSYWWFAGPPALLVAQIAFIFWLFDRR